VVECDPELEFDRETRATIAEKWRSDQERFGHDPEFLARLRPEDEDDPGVFMGASNASSATRRRRNGESWRSDESTQRPCGSV
jgi:hypothetical protein